MVDGFEDNQNRLKQIHNQYRINQERLEALKLKPNSELTDDEIKNAINLKEKQVILEKEIKEIDTNKDEL
jgi:hypothetical protein